MPKLPTWSLACAVVFAAVPLIAQAAPSFDPSQIVDDSYFTGKDAMDVPAIQRFLESQGSVLATAGPNLLGQDANGRSAAQIIYDATRGSRTDFARSSGYGPANPLQISLNPQIILATLQKEQSLLTAKTAKRSALDRAMGYGCPEASSCNPAYAGFADQVVYGSAQLARDYAQAWNSKFVPGQISVIDSQNVRVVDASTSALYQYTPHVYSGNSNLWAYIQRWFAAAAASPYLAKAQGTPTYYVQFGIRHRVRSSRQYPYLTMSSYVVRNLTLAQLQAIPNGPALGLPSQSSDGTVYLVTAGQKWRFGKQSLASWGFTASDAERVDDQLLSDVGGDSALNCLVQQQGMKAAQAVIKGKRLPATAANLAACGSTATLPTSLGIETSMFLPSG